MDLSNTYEAAYKRYCKKIPDEEAAIRNFCRFHGKKLLLLNMLISPALKS